MIDSGQTICVEVVSGREELLAYVSVFLSINRVFELDRFCAGCFEIWSHFMTFSEKKILHRKKKILKIFDSKLFCLKVAPECQKGVRTVVTGFPGVFLLRFGPLLIFTKFDLN